MNFLKKYSLTIFSILTILLSFFIFWKIIYEEVPTDLQKSTEILIKYVTAGSFPSPPLYYFSLHIFSGFSTSAIFINNTAIVLLSCLLLLKYLFSHRLVKSSLLKEENNLSIFEISLLSFLMLFVSPLVYSTTQNYFYLGKLASNVWHDTTLIAVMPFVILLFYQSLKFIKNEQISILNVIYILLFSIINLLIKPSFLYAFIPAFSFILLFKYGIKHKKFWIGLTTLSFIALIIGINYYLVYETSLYNEVLKYPKISIKVKPFFFFGQFSRNISVDFFLSLVFPILCIVFFEKEVKVNLSLQYVMWLFLFAFIIAILFEEGGSRAGQGNFAWQVILVNYLLFLSFASFAYQKIKELGYNDSKSIALIIVFAWHVLSGWVYIHHIITEQKYF